MKKGDLVRPNPLRPALRQKEWRGVIIKVVFEEKAFGAIPAILDVYSIDGFVSTSSDLFEVVEQNFSI
tara:strand:- start:473 stop:676 length:204 start_codon:yes stop_codon:yes gene_type:complete